jgi:transcriptional regulator with XRE-family HTH domain
MNLRNRLRELREQRGLSQFQLALAAEVSPSTVYAYEHGSRPWRPDTLRRLADALGVTVEELVGREPAP